MTCPRAVLFLRACPPAMPDILLYFLGDGAAADRAANRERRGEGRSVAWRLRWGARLRATERGNTYGAH